MNIFKFALLSTPRSGNTWLRYLLARTFGLQQHALHDAQAFDWETAPDRCIVQAHWPVQAAFRTRLLDNGFTPVTIVRHPLDVLISILHFSRYEPATNFWLLGQEGGEDNIRWKRPCDAAFMDYACSPRARALLAVSAGWSCSPPSVRIRYEDLVASPEQTLLEHWPFASSPEHRLAVAIEETQIDDLRHQSTNHHFWLGMPGVWQRVLTEEQSRRIHDTHADLFDALGYDIARTHPAPEQSECDQAWLLLEAAAK